MQASLSARQHGEGGFALTGLQLQEKRAGLLISAAEPFSATAFIATVVACSKPQMNAPRLRKACHRFAVDFRVVHLGLI